MIHVRLRTVDGLLASLDSEGHAIRSGSADSAACAVVSTLLHGAGESFANCRECRIEGAVPEPGRFSMTLESVVAENIPWAAGVTDLLIRQLDFIGREYPEEIEVTHVQE